MFLQGAMGDLLAQCHAQIEKARLAQLFELPHRDLRYIDPLVRPSFAFLTALLQAGSEEGDGLGCGVRNAFICLSAAIPQAQWKSASTLSLLQSARWGGRGAVGSGGGD